MNIEGYCEHFADQLRSRTNKFKALLQNVVHSVDYARAIASLTQEIFSSEVERKLWIDRFGLAYCVLIVPSDLFVTPIKSFFSTDDWKLDDPLAEDLWGPESPYGNSFFEGHALSKGVIQVHFMGDKFPKAANVNSNKGAHDVLLVSDDFLRYLHEPDDRPATESEKVDLDTSDARFQAFLSHNRRAIAHIFDIGDLFIELSPWYCSAIDELSYVTQQSRHLGQHVYLVPGADAGVYPGVFCFVFQRKVGSHYRVLLRFICDRLLTFLRSLDRSEFQRRTVLLQGELAAKHSEFHSLRTALATLGNKLRTLSVAKVPDERHKSITYIQNALDCHVKVLGHLDRLETIALSTAVSWGPTFTLNGLAALWWSQWIPPSCLRLSIMPMAEDEQFQLPGPAPELGQALYQFIEGALKEHDKKSMDEGPVLSMYLDLDDSVLLLDMKSGGEWPVNIEEALRSVNILDRLPSDKPKGGRGILSAIETIRNQYRGNCRFFSFLSTEAGWAVWIPVTIVRQYRLFHERDSYVGD